MFEIALVGYTKKLMNEHFYSSLILLPFFVFIWYLKAILWSVLCSCWGLFYCPSHCWWPQSLCNKQLLSAKSQQVQFGLLRFLKGMKSNQSHADDYGFTGAKGQECLSGKCLEWAGETRHKISFQEMNKTVSFCIKSVVHPFANVNPFVHYFLHRTFWHDANVVLQLKWLT